MKSYWYHLQRDPSAVGIIINKVVGNRYIEKRVNIRVEHIRHSKCRQEFLDRVKRNHEAHVAAKEKGGMYYLSLNSLETSLRLVCVAFRACQPQAPTCPPPRCTDDLDEGQRPPDDDACTLRDHYLKCPVVSSPSAASITRFMLSSYSCSMYAHAAITHNMESLYSTEMHTRMIGSQTP